MNIIVEKNWDNHQHIALVKLNRPKVLNALSNELMDELVQALFKLDDDQDVRVIVLTGDERAFAAGADIAQMVEENPVDKILENRFRSWQQLTMISKPIIAAVSGFALGGGCELAMTCDLIIAGDNARFGQPEINLGIIPGAGGTQRLTKAIGKSKAMLMNLTGEMIDATTAEKWGLVAKVVPAETVLQETYEIAKKEAVNRSFETSLKEGMEFERRNFFLTFSSSDQKEGMRAFLEKREAKYTGR